MRLSRDDGPTSPLTYRDAGVDIETGDRLVDAIRPLAESTRRSGCLDSIGGFGALFEVPPGRYRQPVLVAGTDGVGTKLLLAARFARHHTIGIDLVAMCANDILTCGAEPLFFLDYYATGRLDPDHGAMVIAGIAEGCRQAGAALVGGETAEMPGLYQPGDYDLAGFCVGVVDKERIIDGRAVATGDRLLGLASSGPHANGYSLIRRILDRTAAAADAACGDHTLADALMAPTRIYVRPVLELLNSVAVHGIAHITGGDIAGNLVRILPAGRRARLERRSWPTPAVFEWLARSGPVAEEEMLRTFNCGIGLILAVAGEDAGRAAGLLAAAGETVHQIGVIEDGERSVVIE